MSFEFSFVGLLLLLMLFVPNIVWTRFVPLDYDSYSIGENKILLTLERIGQVLVVAFSLFSGAKFEFSLLLAISFILMLIYEFYWIRYFMSNHTINDMYKSFLAILLPGAVLPVVAFFIFGIYSGNMLLIISTIILGIGHIGIHFNHKRELDF